MNEKAHTLDELDRKIIAVLQQDGRTSNRRIAAELGVTEGTIRGRIKRLEDRNCIRLTAVTNISGSGWPRVALIGIHAAHSELETLCQLPLERQHGPALGRFIAHRRQQLPQSLKIEGLGQVVHRPELDRFDSAVDGRVPRHQHHPAA